MPGQRERPGRAGALGRPLRSYVRGNVALVGDAAHAMAPSLGQGACQALVDADSLAAQVAHITQDAQDADLPAALRAYDRIRRRPKQRLALASRLLSRAQLALA